MHTRKIKKAIFSVYRVGHKWVTCLGIFVRNKWKYSPRFLHKICVTQKFRFYEMRQIAFSNLLFVRILGDFSLFKYVYFKKDRKYKISWWCSILSCASFRFFYDSFVFLSNEGICVGNSRPATVWKKSKRQLPLLDCMAKRYKKW